MSAAIEGQYLWVKAGSDTPAGSADTLCKQCTSAYAYGTEITWAWVCFVQHPETSLCFLQHPETLVRHALILLSPVDELQCDL